MQLEDMFFARFADLTPDGLFTVVGGGLNRINADGFPSSLDLLFLVSRLRLTTEEGQAKHAFAVERETPGGNIEPIGTEDSIDPISPTADLGPDGRLGLTFAFSLVNLLFPEAGIYKYRLKIDGRELGGAELLVSGPAQGEQG
jgi:hypothetical protein